MMRFLMVFAMAFMLATPALAKTCPGLMAKVDAALAANPKLTPEQASEVERLRDQGEDLHDTGNHDQSEAALRQAMEILGIQ
ncbi:MAG: hypothetical protein ACREEE_12335 [Dongiaceae bacterium]